jgi:hypothetical protein
VCHVLSPHPQRPQRSKIALRALARGTTFMLPLAETKCIEESLIQLSIC